MGNQLTSRVSQRQFDEEKQKFLELVRLSLEDGRWTNQVAGTTYREGSAELRSDREATLAAVSVDYCAILAASEELQKDLDVAVEAVRCFPGAIHHVQRGFLGEKRFLLRVLDIFGDAFLLVPEALRSDPDLLLLALKGRHRHPSDRTFQKIFQAAGAELRNDRSIVMEVVKMQGMALEVVGSEFQGDREVVLEAVRSEGAALQYASEALRGDRGLVFAAVRRRPLALRHASEELRGTRDLVLEAVRRDGLALQYVSSNSELKDDDGIVEEAIRKSSGKALLFASPRIKSDRDVVLRVARKYGAPYRYASEELRTDPSIWLEVSKYHRNSLFLALEGHRDCKEAVLLTVRRRGQGQMLRWASERLRDDEEVVQAAVREDPRAWKYASPRLQQQERSKRSEREQQHDDRELNQEVQPRQGDPVRS